MNEANADSKPSRSTSWHKWLGLCALSFSAFFLIGGTIASLAVYISVLGRDEGWNNSGTGIAATALLFSMSCCGIFTGAVADRFGGRLVIAAGFLASAVGCLFAARASSVVEFSAALALVGLGLAGATVPGTAVITRLFTTNRALAMAVYVGAMTLASGFVPAMVEAIIEARGWRTAMMITSAAIGVCFLLVASIRLEPSIEADGENSEERNTPSTGLSMSEGLRSFSFWCTTLAMTLALLSVYGVMLGAVAYLTEGKMELSRAVAIYSISSLVGVLGLFIGGAWADRVGARKILFWALLMQGAGTLILTNAFAPGVYGSASIGIYVVLWGFAGGLPSQLGPVLLADVVGMRHFGALYGINSALTGLVSALAPLGTGWLRQIAGSYNLPFIICGALVVVAAPMLLLVRPYGTAPCDSRSHSEPLR